MSEIHAENIRTRDSTSAQYSHGNGELQFAYFISLNYVYSAYYLFLQCMSIYQEYKHSCFLYLGSIIVDEFGAEKDYQDSLITFLMYMSSSTFPLLAADNGLLLHPDTVDDIFRMCARYVCGRKYPVNYNHGYTMNSITLWVNSI